MGATNLQTHSRIHHTHSGSRLWEEGLFSLGWKVPGGEVCFLLFCSKSHFAFHGVGRSSLEVPRVNFSLGWFCIWCGGWRHSMQIIAGVFRGTVQSRGGERKRETSLVENLVVKQESKAWCCGHLRQRIKVLHPVICPMETCLFFDSLLDESVGTCPMGATWWLSIRLTGSPVRFGTCAVVSSHLGICKKRIWGTSSPTVLLPQTRMTTLTTSRITAGSNSLGGTTT